MEPLLQNSSPWLFPQQNEVPTLAKLNSMFKGGGSASTSLEAKAGQRVADLRHTRDVQARYGVSLSTSGS